MSGLTTPELYRAQPDRGATPALLGFLCALASLVASLVASVFAGFQTPVGNTPVLRRLVPILQRLHDTFAPATTSGEAMLLFTAAFLATLVGLILCLRGTRSSSRRWLAITGLLLSGIVMLCYIVILVIVSIGMSQMFRYG